MNTTYLILLSPLIIAIAFLLTHLLWSLMGIGLPAHDSRRPLRQVAVIQVAVIQIAPQRQTSYHAVAFRSAERRSVSPAAMDFADL